MKANKPCSGHLVDRGGYYHTVIYVLENGKRKPVSRTTGLPVKNNLRKAQKILEDRKREYDEMGLAGMLSLEERDRLQWNLVFAPYRENSPGKAIPFLLPLKTRNDNRKTEKEHQEIKAFFERSGSSREAGCGAASFAGVRIPYGVPKKVPKSRRFRDFFFYHVRLVRGGVQCGAVIWPLPWI